MPGIDTHQALIDDIPNRFPVVRTVVWFNWSSHGMDWAIESSLESQQAFAEGIGSSYYMDNEFSNLRTSPIPPCVEVHERWPSLLPSFENE